MLTTDLDMGLDSDQDSDILASCTNSTTMLTTDLDSDQDSDTIYDQDDSQITDDQFSSLMLDPSVSPYSTTATTNDRALFAATGSPSLHSPSVASTADPTAVRANTGTPTAQTNAPANPVQGRMKKDLAHAMRRVYRGYRKSIRGVHRLEKYGHHKKFTTHYVYAILLQEKHIEGRMSSAWANQIDSQRLIACLRKAEKKNPTDFAKLCTRCPNLREILNREEVPSANPRVEVDQLGIDDFETSFDNFKSAQLRWSTTDLAGRWNLIERIMPQARSPNITKGKLLFHSAWTTVNKGRLQVDRESKDVAIKTIPFGDGHKYTEQQAQDEIFLMMATYVLSVNVLPIYHWRVDRDNKKCEIITPLAKLTLRQYLKNFKSIWESLDACINVAKALERLNAYGIFHRSVRPQSVYLVEGIYRLANFGTACQKGFPDHGRQNDFSSPLNAPELRNNPQSTDCPKADVYSFGVLMWSVFTKFNPAKFKSGMETYFGQAWDTYPLPIPVSGCPPRIIELIRSCWNPDPAQRPSFTDILRVLQSEQRSTPPA